MKNSYPTLIKLSQQKLLLLAFFLGVSSMIAQTNLELEVEMAAQETQNESPSYQTFADGIGCDNALPITSGDLTDELIICGDEDLLNTGSVGVFCDDGGSPVPEYYGQGIEATYTYLPSEDGTVDITVHNTDWTALFIYDGCPTGDGECVATTRSTEDSRNLSFEAEAGTEYFIWIDVWVTASSASGELCDQGALMDFSGPQPGDLDECAGVPESISLNAPESICGGIGFTIQPEDIPAESGLVYQWQSHPAEEDTAEFTDIEDGISKNLNVNDLSEDTTYRLIVTCENTEEEVISEEAVVTLSDPSDCYCTPTYSTGCTSGDRISNVSLTGESVALDNDSECSTDAHGDYTDLTPPDLAPGEAYTLSVSTDYSSPSSEDVRVWIDFNSNGTFEDSEEIANTEGDGLPSSGTGEFQFTVPENVEPAEYKMRVKLDYSSGDIDPCEGATWGETEDYTVEVIQLDECQDPVYAGEAVDTTLDVCAGNSFSIAITGASDPANNLTRQWQSSPAGEDDWTDIEDAHSNNYTVSEGVEEPTDFRYKVVCSDGDPDYSNIIEVNLNPANECYCTPIYTTGCSSSKITNVSLTGESEVLDNNSQCSDNAYGDYSEDDDLSKPDLAPGETYTLSVSTDYVSPTFEQARAWIDYNQDGQFTDDEKIADTNGDGLAGGTGTFDFTVPEGLDADNYRLRVRLVYGSAAPTFDACGSETSGEAEDYTVEIIQLDDCQGTPTAGTIEEDFSVCAGNAFSISVSGASDPANGLSRIWQSSPEGEEDWSDIEGAQSTTYILEAGIDEPTDFQYKVTCENSNETDISEVMEVSIKPAIECYCTPEGTNASRYINNFSTTDAIDNVSNLNSGFSPGGYGDFTDMILSQENTQEVSFDVDVEGGTAGFRMWIDWNQDGQFSADEVVYQSDGYSASHTGSFTVPENVDPGQTRMRIASHWLSQTGDIDPCETGFSYGEFEDYTFEVIELEDCEGMPSAGTPEEDELLVCAGIPFTVSVSDASGAANNLDRRWQSSPAGEDDWTDISGSGASSFVIQDGVSEPTDFRYAQTCNEEDTDISDIIEVTLKPAIECYCIPGGTNSSYYIDNFSTTGGEENIENLDSGYSEDGYGDFTETHTVSQLHTQPIDFEADYVGTTFGTKIWVDWNQDGMFDENEIVYQSSSYSSSESGSFEVPESAVLGTTRMRIGISSTPSSGPNDPCEVGTREFEDYTFEVLPLEDCEGMPSAGTPDEDELLVCAGMPFTVLVSDPTGAANNLYRRWQSSPAGEDDWTDIDDSNSPTYTSPEGVFEPTDFRYVLTCNEEDTDISDIIEVILKPGNECYCIPEGASNNSDEILNFTLANLDNDSSPSEGENGYSDYTDLPAIQLIPGLGYVASLTSGSGFGNHGAAIWIDYNDDGFFSEDEKVATISNSISSSSTVEFPEFITSNQVGEHRLRVQYTYNRDGEELDPCEVTNTSETEDYTALVVDVDCFPPTGIEINYITDVSAQVNWEANDEDSWVVIYGEEGFDPEEEEENVIQVEDIPSADLTDLDDDTTYEVYVKTICGEDESILIGPVQFTTNITPPENTRLCDAIPLEPNSGCIGGPYTNVAAFEEADEPIGTCHNDYRGENTVWFTFIASGDGEAVITTDFNSTEIQTEIVVFEAPTDCEDMTTLGEEVGCANAADEGILELEGLTPGATYYVKVGGFNNTEGLFCIEVQLEEVPVCFAPTEINIGEISDETVEVSWTAGGDETQWEVIYGEAGFNPETTGQSEIVNTTQVTLTDLTPETDYDVYVRAICTQLNSDLAGPELFTTEPMSVDSQIFANFTFYPNPVKDQLTLKAGTTIENVEVYNLLGQNVISAKPNSLEAQINTDALQSGVYLMKVSINGSQKTFRVVKK